MQIFSLEIGNRFRHSRFRNKLYLTLLYSGVYYFLFLDHVSCGRSYLHFLFVVPMAGGQTISVKYFYLQTAAVATSHRGAWYLLETQTMLEPF